MICAKVRAACEANATSSWANCGGADCGGCASATTRRSTTATAMTMHIQKPMRSQRKGWISGAVVFPTPVFRVINLLLGLNIMLDRDKGLAGRHGVRKRKSTDHEDHEEKHMSM